MKQARSLVDLVRATVVFEEPYSMACFVKYMQKTFRVVRMKNRFADDVVEKISAAELQQQFYAAESWGYEDGSSEASGSTYGRSTYEKMYRDVLLNVEVPREAGAPFIAEIQVASAPPPQSAKKKTRNTKILTVADVFCNTTTTITIATFTTITKRIWLC